MSFLPASFEILAYILFAPMLLGITQLEAAVMAPCWGCVPGSVVPRMVRLMEEGRGIPGRRSPAHSRRSLLR